MANLEFAFIDGETFVIHEFGYWRAGIPICASESEALNLLEGFSEYYDVELISQDHRAFRQELRRQKEAGIVPKSSPVILLSKLGKV